MLHARYRTRVIAAVLCALVLLGASQSVAARTLDTRYGAVEIDGTPARVVTLYEGALDAAVALGAEPVAAIATRGGDGVARYIADRVPGIAIVGTAREINIESVIAQRPDVILASPNLDASRYRLLSQIAPTVVPANAAFAPDAWQQETRLFARALGRTDQAEKIIDQVADRAARIRAELPADHDAALLRWMPQGPLVMSPIIFSARVLAAAGFNVTDAGVVPEGRPHSDPLSLENLGRIDGDWLFLATLNPEGDDALDAARRSPAFKRLDVVEHGHVVPVDGQLWTSASGPIAAGAILDAIDDTLAASR